jgi:integrase
MALAAGEDMKGLRDRALLLFGFAGAFRRSELVALDLEESELGFKVTIRHSKTGQEGAGQTIAIVRGSVACPVAALKAWLEAAAIATGPVFRSVKKTDRTASSVLGFNSPDRAGTTAGSRRIRDPSRQTRGRIAHPGKRHAKMIAPQLAFSSR